MQALVLLTQGQQKAGLTVGTITSLTLLILDIKRAFDVGGYLYIALKSQVLCTQLWERTALLNVGWNETIMSAPSSNLEMRNTHALLTPRRSDCSSQHTWGHSCACSACKQDL